MSIAQKSTSESSDVSLIGAEKNMVQENSVQSVKDNLQENILSENTPVHSSSDTVISSGNLINNIPEDVQEQNILQSQDIITTAAIVEKAQDVQSLPSTSDEQEVSEEPQRYDVSTKIKQHSEKLNMKMTV